MRVSPSVSTRQWLVDQRFEAAASKPGIIRVNPVKWLVESSIYLFGVFGKIFA
jgi:hypothetical protein